MTAVFVECKPEIHNHFDGQYEGKIMHDNMEYIDGTDHNLGKTKQTFVKFNDTYSYNMFLKYGSIVYCNINGNIQRGIIRSVECDNTTCRIIKMVFGANRSVSGGERLNSGDVQRISKEFDEDANIHSPWYITDSGRYFVNLDDIDSILIPSDTYNICKKMEDNTNDDNIGIGSRVKQRHKLKKEQIEQKQREMDQMFRVQNELQIMFDEYRQNCIYYDCLLLVIILICVFISMIY